MSEKLKKVCRDLNYIDHSLIATSAITRCFSISTFASLVGISIGRVSSTIGLKICVLNVSQTNY